MSRRRRCFFGCEGNPVIFKFPSNDTTRARWSEFVHGDNPSPKNAFVCARHFTDDGFVNKDLFDSGKISRLCLKTGAVPTIRDAAPPEPTTVGKKSTPADSVPFSYKRTVATQLSARTLVSRRSVAVQANVGKSSRDTDAEQPGELLSSNLQRTFSQRPLKRPHMDMEEEDISMPFFHDSPSDPGNSVTDGSELTTELRPDDCEDAKYIVFESCLREIFETCPICKRQCDVVRRICGTFVSFSQVCPRCSYSRKWQSQPLKGTTPLGNLQLSAAVYISGGSFTKVSEICKAMNLQLHQYEAFKRHTRTYIEPAIHHKWKVDQEKLLEEVKTKGKVALAGDMRAESLGRCARFGSYTIMELKEKKILDIQLVQSSKVGGSTHMEKEGLRRCLEMLESRSVEVDCVFTDRHPRVQKCLRERATTRHYGVRHVVQRVSKKSDTLTKKRGFKVVKKWLPAVKKHMYWTAASSETHEDPLFSKCPHPDQVSKWLQPGTEALHEVDKLLLNKTILKDVAKSSSSQQTSGLESFHSSILRFAPKSVAFPFTGMLCRLYLAAMHHNNVFHKQSIAMGTPFRMTFSKSTRGRATAKPKKTAATYEYQTGLIELISTEIWDNPVPFIAELQKVNEHGDLCARFEGPTKEEFVAAGHVSRINQGVSGRQRSAPQGQETPGVSGL